MRARVKASAGLPLFRIVCLLFGLAVFGAEATTCCVALEPAAPVAEPADMLPEALPEAPEPNLTALALGTAAEPSASSSSAFDPAGFAGGSASGGGSAVAGTAAQPAAKMTSEELDADCQLGALRGKPCRAQWLPILWESLESTALQNAGNIALDTETRDDLLHNAFWATYVKCVHQLRYRQWRDDDDFMVDYVGHGMQGAIAASIFEQHSPTGRGLVYENNGNYWRSRLKAMAWITVYEIQWKIGPASEASIGNSGLNTYFTPRVQGRSTNETGFQDFFDTPVVGFWWNVAEDAMDRFVMPHIWARTHNKLILTALFPLTPCKAAANLLRYKPFYYRDFPLTALR